MSRNFVKIPRKTQNMSPRINDLLVSISIFEVTEKTVPRCEYDQAFVALQEYKLNVS
jgi:hypothetical protein